MASTEPIVRISRAEELSRRLEQEIVDNGLPAGERLGTKEDIRNRFGYAVATVNEALRLLETRGLIEARPGPGGGMFVASPSSRVRLNHLVLGFKVDDAPFTDCLAVRNALEPLVCREAAANCKAADAKALRGIVARMRKQEDNPKAFLRLNWDLHRRMAKMDVNAPLKTLYLTLLDKLPETVVLTIDRREVLREYHPKIVELSRDEASDVPRGGPLATMPA